MDSTAHSMPRSSAGSTWLPMAAWPAHSSSRAVSGGTSVHTVAAVPSAACASATWLSDSTTCVMRTVGWPAMRAKSVRPMAP